MIAAKYCGRHIMSMGNYAFLCIFFIKYALIWCSARPCADRTGFARQVVQLLAFVTMRPALALMQRAERRVHLPKDAEPLAGGHSQAATTQKWLGMRRWEHPLPRRRRCAHRGTGWSAHTSRPGSPQHMRRRIPTTIACMTCGRGSRWRVKFNLGIWLRYFIKA